MEGLKLARGRELALCSTFCSSAVVSGGEVRGLCSHSFSKLVIPPSARSGSVMMAGTTPSISKSSCGVNCNLRSGQRRGLVTSQPSFRAPSRWDLASSAGNMSNQVRLRKLTRIERHLNSKESWTTTRTISMNAAPGGTPPQVSFIVKLLEKVIQFIASVLPSKALVEKVEEEVDTVAEFVKQGVKIVVEVADEVEKVSNILEINAEGVEKLAQKVGQITEEVKKVVDDVADVLEGEKEASSLVHTYQTLKKDASAIARTVQTEAPSRAVDSGDDTTTTSEH